jgi:Fe-S-cluster-containing dehydrogenase component
VANEMAILQEVDKCVRCNGCVISCKRTWHMKGMAPVGDLPHNKLAANQRVVIKSQRRVDMGPFVRFSCWHCKDAPCQGRCPFKAIKKDPDSGAVWIDPNDCKPGTANAAGVTCVQQCKTDCQRGGVPYIGGGSDLFTTSKAWKCTLCTGTYAGAPCGGAGLTSKGADLPTKAPGTALARNSQLVLTSGTLPNAGAIEELDHQPTCVFTCPAKAMVYDTRANIIKYLEDTGQGWMSRFGDGSMFWASHKFVVSPPKADPFMEDHVAPMLSGLFSSPFARAALAPTLVVGGLLALAARRAKIEEEALTSSGEVR